MTTSLIERASLEALVRSTFDQLERDQNSTVSHDGLIGSQAARLAGIAPYQSNGIDTELGFAEGFTVALELAAIVASDPLGSRRGDFAAVLDSLRARLEAYRAEGIPASTV